MTVLTGTARIACKIRTGMLYAVIWPSEFPVPSPSYQTGGALLHSIPKTKTWPDLSETTSTYKLDQEK